MNKSHSPGKVQPGLSADDDARVVDTLVKPANDEIADSGKLLARIHELLEAESYGQLIGPAGDAVRIPGSVMTALRMVAEAMAVGRAVTVAPHDLELTTQEAADILHVSRPHLIKLLDNGDLGYYRTSNENNSHRRLRLSDVISYRNARQKTRRSALQELTQDAQSVPGGYR